MDDTGSSRPTGTSARERALHRDRETCARLGLNPRAQHGDVDINGDLVDELAGRLNPQPESSEPGGAPRCPYCGRVMSNREAAEQGACNACYGGAWSPDEDERAARLAACITGVDERMERMHLACLLKALERLPS